MPRPSKSTGRTTRSRTSQPAPPASRRTASTTGARPARPPATTSRTRKPPREHRVVGGSAAGRDRASRLLRPGAGLLHGSWVALPTPVDDLGRIDTDSLARLVDHHLAAHTDGLVIAGTTGESPCLSDDEKCQLLRLVARRARGRLHLMLGTGGNDTRHTVELTRQAADAGADAVLVVTPYYNKPTPAGLRAHFEAVARATQLPVVLYNVPGRTGVNLPVGTTLELATIDNVAAIKEASGNLIQVQEIIAKAPPGFAVMSGDDALNLPIMAVGGTGVISVTGNVAPRRLKACCDAVRRGDLAEARRRHLELLPLHQALFLESNPVPVKAALALMGLLGDHFRLPLVPARAATRAVLAEVLATLGVLPDAG